MPDPIQVTVVGGGTVDVTPEKLRLIEAVSPTAIVEENEDGALWTVHDLNGTTTAQIRNGAIGPQGPQGEPGQDGADGFSPTASVSKSGGTATITITDKNGTTTASVTDGTNGQDGAPGQDGTDGVSPVVAITSITGGHEVTITDAEHPSGQSFNVMDGQQGPSGEMATVTVSGTTPSITGESNHRYICGEVSTLTVQAPESGCIDVVFESGSTATVLTVTSAKSGVTAIKWANGWDGTCEANAVYEINILDGELGVMASWT